MKLNRTNARVGKRTVDEQEAPKETPEAQAPVQVIYTDGSTLNDEGKLVTPSRPRICCDGCKHVLDLSRGIDIRLTCPNCGGVRFKALDNFRIENPNREKTIREGDDLTFSGQDVWKVW